jgi:hypothetical protein
MVLVFGWVGIRMRSVLEGTANLARRHKHIFDRPAQRLVRTLLALLPPLVYLLIVQGNQLPSVLAYAAMFLFLPGMIAVVWLYSLEDDPGPFPRPATQRAMAYASAAAGILAVTTVMRPVLVSSPLGTLPGLWFEPSTEFPLVVTVPLLAVAFLMGAYALKHRGDLDQLESQMQMLQLEEQIDQDDLLKSWNPVAERIQQYLRFHRVVIITLDGNYHASIKSVSDDQLERLLSCTQFSISGFAGPGREGMDSQQFKACGISLQVIRQRKSLIVDDTTQVEGYFDNGLEAGSELYVPVINPDCEKEVIALLVAQDKRWRAFSRTDKDQLERVARNLGAFARHLMHLASYAQLRHVSESLHDNGDGSVDQLLTAVRQVFGTDFVGYVPLAFATYRPQPENSQSLKDSFAAMLVDPQINLAADPDVARSIRTWRPVLLLDRVSSQSTARLMRKMASRAGLQALALVPTGGHGGAGALFVIGFTQGIGQQASHLETLLSALAHNFSPLVDREWQSWWRYQSTFLTPSLELHRLLNQYTLNRDAPKSRLEKAVSGDTGELENLKRDLSQFIASMFDLEASLHPLDKDDSLQRVVKSFSDTLQNRHSFIGWRKIDPRIESESMELKVILYKLICEAMLNALNHGRASQVSVIVARGQSQIKLLVFDNGIGFDTAQLGYKPIERHGIVWLSQWVSEVCDAERIDWLWTAPSRGACFKLVIPCLPLAEDQQQFEKNEAEVYMDMLEKLYA